MAMKELWTQEEAGADAALVALETAGEKEALAKLEEIAQEVLP